MNLLSLLSLLACLAVAVDCRYFRLQEGYEYVYNEEMACHLLGSGTILVNAKVSFSPFKKNGTKLEIAQTVYHAVFKDKRTGQQTSADAFDFSQWFSFVLSLEHGDIEKVYHPPGEDLITLALKKAFTTMVFGKLHSHDDPTLEDVNHDPVTGKWNYSTHENGNEGLHHATYMAEPTDRGYRFTKTRNKHPHLKAAENNYTKVLHYDSHLGLVSRVNVDEFLEIGKTPEDLDEFEFDRPRRPNDTYIKGDIPTMKAASSGTAEILARNRLRGPVFVKPKTGLVDGMIHVDVETNKKTEKRVKHPNHVEHFKANLTCLRDSDKYGSSHDIGCFRGLVHVLKNLPDDELISVAEKIFYGNRTVLDKIIGRKTVSNEKLYMVDALMDVGTELAAKIAADYAFKSNPETLKRLFMHVHDVDRPSFDIIDDMIEKYCFFPETFPAELQDEETHHEALLALGSLVKRHYTNGKTDNAHRVLMKLENMLGIHDPFVYNKRRSSLVEEDAHKLDFKHVILLESLGNAAMDRSYDHIISYVNSSSQIVIKRAGLHALRHMQHDKAVTTLYQAATKHENDIIRHEATLILQRHRRKAMYPLVHPEGSDTGSVVVREGPETRAMAHIRKKRDLMEKLFKGFDFHLQTPTIDWRKQIGGKKIGASIGVHLENLIDILISLLEGFIKIVIHNEAYARLHLGLVFLPNIDFMLARICFKGHTEYNLNILQEFSFKDLLKQIKDFFKSVKDAVKAVKDGVAFLQKLINGDIKLKDIIAEFVDALEQLPDKVADIVKRAWKAMKMIGSFEDKELPLFLRPAKNVILRITNLYIDIKTDVMNFYEKVSNSAMIIKRSLKSIFDSVKALIKSVPNILKSPKVTLANIAKAVMNVKLAIKEFLDAKNATMEACFFLKDEKPYWWDLKKQWGEIANETKQALEGIQVGGKKWVTELAASEDPISKLTKGKFSTKQLKEKFLAELKSVIESLTSPFKTMLGKLIQPFLDAFNKVVDIITKFKKAYEQLVKGFNTARELISNIFGPRAHPSFPRRTRESGSGVCSPDGFYPSNIGGYTYPGVDLLFPPNKPVPSPFGGVISLPNTGQSNEVKICSTGALFAKTCFYVSNVKANSSVQSEDDPDYTPREVYSGQIIGTSIRSPCDSRHNHLHLAMKKPTGIMDPTKFLHPRAFKIPQWKQECNDYKFVWKGQTKAAGWASAGARSKDDMPPEPATPSTGMKANSQNEPAGVTSPVYDKLKAAEKRRKRAASPGKKSPFEKLLGKSLKKLSQMLSKLLEKLNIKNLKLGKIITFLENLGLDESKKALAQVILRIKELIDAKPCFNPHQMTDEQLRNELRDRMLSVKGSREQMIQRLLTTEPTCPLLQLKMPKSIHCVFDKNCLAVQCCMNIKVMMFNMAVRAFMRLDPCDFKFVMGVNNWRYSLVAKDLYFNKEGKIPTGLKFKMFGLELEIIIRYKIEKDDKVALVSFSLAACSPDDHTSCSITMPLLDEAVIPLPICHKDGSITWPKVDWSKILNADAVKKQLKEAGKKVMNEMVKAAAKEILKQLGIPASLLLPNGPCSRPETMTLKALKKELKSRGLADTGKRKELNERLLHDDLSCKVLKKPFTLPAITNPTLKKHLYYSISSTCTRLDACADFEIKKLNYIKSFRVFLEMDVCKYVLKFGFESKIHTVPVFVFGWGLKQYLKISNKIVVGYKIDRDDTKKSFIVDLSIKMCLKPGDCPIDIVVFTGKEIPQPLCNKDFSMDAFKPGDGSLKTFLKELGGEMNVAAFNYILKLFKLDKVLSDDPCTLPITPHPTCPWKLNLSWLPAKVRQRLKCRQLDNCEGVRCCLHLPFKLPLVSETINKYVGMVFKLKICEFSVHVEFGSLKIDKKLAYTPWGEEVTWKIGHGDPVVISYSFKKQGNNVIVNMKVLVCLKIQGNDVCIPDEDGMVVLKDKVIPLCSLKDMAAYAARFKASSLKDYFKEQMMVAGKALVGAGIDMLLEQTGLKEYLKDPQCDGKKSPYTPSVNGWRNQCKESLFKIPRLPDKARCHLDESCTKLDCCISVDFLGTYTRSVHFSMTLDSCDLIFKITLDKLTFEYTLLTYHFGKVEKFSMLNMLNIEYSIQKDKARKVFILNAVLCVSFNKNGVCDHEFKFFKDTEVPQLQCDLTAGIGNLPESINKLKKYMNVLKSAGKQATGFALMIPLRMLKLGKFIGIEGMCPQPGTPVKNACTRLKAVTAKLKALSNGHMQCDVQPECRGIECCIQINLGFMTRVFRTYVTIDPFSYQLTIGFEQFQLIRYLITYTFGKEETAMIGSAIKLVFSVGKTKSSFILNLRIETTIADYLPIYVTILRNFALPIPTRANSPGAKIKFPFGSWAAFKKSLGKQIGAQAGEAVWQATMKFLGLEDIIDGSLCEANSLKKVSCPRSMPKYLEKHCVYNDMCTGVICCVEIDFKVVKKTLKVAFSLDTSKPSVSLVFEKFVYQVTMPIDERTTIKVTKFLNVIYKVIKTADANQKPMFSIDLFLQIKLHDEILEVPILVRYLLPPQAILQQAWKLAIGDSLFSFQFLQGAVTKAALNRLGVKDFFDATPCQVPSSPPAKNACKFSIPKWIDKRMRIIPKANSCLGVQACVKLRFLSIEYEFKAMIDFNLATYTIRVKVEKFEWTKSLFENMGQERTITIRNIAGVSYKLTVNPNGQLVVDLGVGLCIDGHCSSSSGSRYKLLDNAVMPLPYVDDNGKAVWPTSGNMKDWLYNRAFDMTRDLLGVAKDFFRKKTCSLPTPPTCKDPLVPKLDFARCQPSKYCTGIECCVDVQMKLAKWSFMVWALLDPCEFVVSVGFEKWMMNFTLLEGYQWGKTVKTNIANNMIAIEYMIGKTADNKYFIVTVKVSIKLDKFGINIPQMVLLDKKKIPIPYCNKEAKIPSLSWTNPTSEASGMVMTSLGMPSSLTKSSPCKAFTTDNKARCPYFSKPKTLMKGLTARAMDICTGIEACLELDLKIVKRMVTASIMIDPCKLFILLKFEKWEMKKSLLASTLFGNEIVENISSAVSLKYTIDKTADNRDFIFTLKVELCLGGTCIEMVIVDKVMMPIPFCASDGSFKWPAVDKVKINGKLVKSASAMVLNVLNAQMENVFGEECKAPTSSGAVCPYSVLTSLPANIKCEHTKYCTGITCCATLDLKIVKRNFKVWAILDPCEFTISIGFDRVRYDRSLTGYTFGTKQTLKIGNVRIHYTIDVSKNQKEFIMDVSIELCLNSKCFTKHILQRKTMPIPFCKGVLGNFAIEWPSVKNYGSLLYNILGVGLDFFKPKPCIAQTPTRTCPGVSEKLPDFAKKYCQLKSNCLGLEQCCFDLDLHVTKIKVSFYFYFDQCKNELHFGFESKTYVIKLDADMNGKKKLKAIGSMLNVNYVIYNTGYTFKASVDIDWCWKNPFTKKKTCGKFDFLKEASFKQIECPKRKKRSVEQVIPPVAPVRERRASTLKKIKDVLQRGKDVWAITKDLLKQGKTAEEIKAVFEKLKKERKKVGLSKMEPKENGGRGQLSSIGGQGPASFVSGNRIKSGDLQVEGAEAIKAILGKAEEILGRVDEMFTPGSGLTKAGVELLSAQLADMTVGQLIAMLDAQNLDPVILYKLIKDLKRLFEAIYNDLIDAFLSRNMKELGIGDLLIKKRWELQKTYATFFQYSIFFMVGPVPVTFTFGVQGYTGMDIEIGAKILRMWAYAIATPYAGVVAYGEVAVGAILYAKLRLEGTICEIRFPAMADVYFNKFPLDVCLRMDLVLIPLIIRLKGLVTIEIDLKFKTIKKVIFEAIFYELRLAVIRKNIFTKCEREEDESPPDVFEEAGKPLGVTYNHAAAARDAKKEKRQIGQARTCSVEQLKNRDYTSPAVQIGVRASDTRSQCKILLDVGFSPGGTEVISGRELTGEVTTLTEVFKPASGRKTYFHVCAVNSAGNKACVDCSIPTYDITKPALTVQSDFLITSNPGVLLGYYRSFDDSELVQERVGCGYGKGLYDDQTCTWKAFSSSAEKKIVPSGHPGYDGIEHFAHPIEGRLDAVITKTYTLVHSENQCARHCLEFPTQQCMSYNYDYGPDGTCELLGAIRHIDNPVKKSGKFVHFEKLGIGNEETFTKTDLDLQHNKVYYINVAVKNYLGYQNIGSSRGVLHDRTMPNPGFLGDIDPKRDVLEEFLLCEELVENHKKKWMKYCKGVKKNLHNHRRHIDGKGAKTVFNGLEPGVDLLYTRAKLFIGAWWDGFHDNESGIRGYTAAVGKKICEAETVPHLDPHHHIHDEKHWTLMVTMSPDPKEAFEDGIHYITVRAFNKADYGGPLAVTVCHSTPYVIDNSPPINAKVNNIQYEEKAGKTYIKADHNSHDPESKMKNRYSCLGLSYHGCEVQEWFPLPPEDVTPTTFQFPYTLPDGVPVWVKLDAHNNVDLFSVAAADYPVMVDESPPGVGTIYDGDIFKIDQRFSKEAKKICLNWFGFNDPQSGIRSFEVSAGDAPFATNIVDRYRVGSHHHTLCVDVETPLVHKTKKYYATVHACNNGINQLCVNATSDGFIVDLTKPVLGGIFDGDLKNKKDVKISSMGAMVAAQIDPPVDPESGIKDIEMMVEVRQPSEANFEVVHAFESIYPATSFQRAHFHLGHKYYVKTTVRATNGAGAISEKTSDGFLVDRTPPQLKYLNDGPQSKTDIEFQSFTDKASVNFDFVDKESGIKCYRVELYAVSGLTKNTIHKSANCLPGDQNVYTATGLSTLQNGATVYAKVESENWAEPGQATRYVSSGFKIDTTAPAMIYVVTGAMAGENEELYGGHVIWSDPKAISGNWKAIESESGLADFEVCVGSAKDKCDVLYWKSMGTAEDGYISGLDLKIHKTSKTLYYLRVRARNEVGLVSDAFTGTPIEVVDTDKTGHPIDGADGTDDPKQKSIGADMDYTTDAHTVTCQFEGFESHEYGIQHVEWKVSRTTEGEEEKPFGAEGIVLSDGSDTQGLVGQIGAGKASAALYLETNTKYYCGVRATTYGGNVLESISDGFMIDHTPPKIAITSLALASNTQDLTEGNFIYQQTDAMLSGSWQYSEDVSGIAFAQVCFSTVPGACDLLPLTNIGAIRADLVSSIPDEKSKSTVKPKRGGGPNLLEIYAGNDVGLITRVASAVIYVDDTAPICGLVTCPKHVKAGAMSVTCSWSGFMDKESTISGYEFCVGSAPGKEDIFPCKALPANNMWHMATGFKTPLKAKTKYYATVKAKNPLKQECKESSDAISVDDSPPVAGVIVETIDLYTVNFKTPSKAKDDKRNQRTCKTDKECASIDATCQNSLNSVSVAWTPFSDPETGIASLHAAVGTSPGGGQIKSFFRLPSVKATSYTFTGLDLRGKETAYVTLKAYNGAGMSTSVMSNGVHPSYAGRYSPKPLRPIEVRDGDNAMQELDYQTDLERLSAKWDTSGDPCPAANYEWSIERVDGKVVQDFTSTHGKTTGNYDFDKPMLDGETYFVKVRSESSLGSWQARVYRSDGVTVRRDQLLPGMVKDGLYRGYDLTHQPRTDILEAHWIGFGQRKKASVTSGNAGVNNQEKNQEVRYYEYAVGTDRRFEQTRDNIVPFTKTSEDWVQIKYLKLSPCGVYYFTVIAHSASAASAQITSNGVIAGCGGGINYNDITMKGYWSDTKRLVVKWDDFQSDVGVLFYHVGVSKQASLPADVSCRKMVLSEASGDNLKEKLFPVSKLKNVDTSTLVELSDISLVHNTVYYAYVIGTDQSGLCNMTSHEFKVDATPPDGGEVKIGPYWDSGAAYTRASVEIPGVEWRGFKDDESGLDHYEISLWRATCTVGASLQSVVDWIRLDPDKTKYNLIDLSLVTGTAYYVKLRAVNKAGLAKEIKSKPILLDETEPVAGRVVMGENYLEAETWHDSTTSVDGNFLHYATTNGDPCPDRSMPLLDFTKIDSGLGVVRGVHWGVQYDKNGVTIANGVALIGMTRVTGGYTYLRSGALYTNADIVHGNGAATVTLQAADSDVAVTSMMFWDGGDNQLHDYNYEEDPNWTGTCDCCFKTPTPKDCPCDCAAYKQAKKSGTLTQATKAKKKGKPNSYPAAAKKAPTKFTTHRACGFQLIAGKDPYAIVWCTFYDEASPMLRGKYDLDFDPSKSTRTYKMELEVNRDNPNQVDRCFSVYESSKITLIGELCGLDEFSGNTRLIISLWNKDNFIPLSNNWTPKATVSSVKLSPAKDRLCRYGKSFQGGKSAAIIAYEGAIGSEPLKNDVAAFRVVSRPCIPCLKPCDVFTCDKSCPKYKVTNLKYTMTGLTLPLTRKVDGKDVTAVYYLTVKAVLGSGAVAIASSDSFKIDKTAPVINNEVKVTYLSVTGKSMPITHSSSPSTIKAIWIFNDLESLIVEYSWCVGEIIGKCDLQPMTSTGINPTGTNSKLKGHLLHNHTYYVTVEAINGAGIKGTYADPKGLTVLLEPPVVKDIKCTNGGKPVTSPKKNSKKTGDGTTVTVSWTKPRDKNIARIDLGIGTSECSNGKKWKDNIFPFTWLGLKEAGKVEIKNGAVYLNGKKLDDLCKFVKPNKNYVKNIKKNKCIFNMEIGRTIFVCMKLCDKADQCTLLEGGSITFIKDGKCTVSSSTNGKGMTVNVVASKARKKRSTGGTVIKTPEGLLPGMSLVVGLLDAADVKATYGSDASVEFRKYIQDPSATMSMTERALKGRIISVPGDSFFVNSISHAEMPGPMVVTVAYLAAQKTEKGRPMLLHWDTGSLSWVRSYKSCTSHSGSTETFDAAKLVLNTLVCQTHSEPTSTTTTRKKRALVFKGFFNKETQFLIAVVNNQPVNNPPVVTKVPMLTVAEDSAIIYHNLTATDKDGDKFVFAVDNSKPAPSGKVSIAPDGKMEYSSCMDCAGIDTVYFIVTEVEMGDMTPLTTRASIVITITGTPDGPEMFLSRNGIAVFSMEKTVKNVHDVDVVVEQDTGYNVAYKDLEFLVGAYDRDVSDTLTIVSQSPVNGRLILGQPDSTKPTIPKSCAGLKASSGAASLPCHGLKLPHEESKLSWVRLEMTYKPDRKFHGLDSFVLKAVDSKGLVSNKVTVNVYVLRNPCKNNGTCYGKEDDYQCINHRRASAPFHDFYKCECRGGWSGDTCDVDVDDCAPAPCAFPKTCYDKLGGYECRCPANWPNCDIDHLTPGIVFSLLAVAVFGALIGLAVWCHMKRKARYDKYKRYDDSRPGSSDSLELLEDLDDPFWSIPGVKKHITRIKKKTGAFFRGKVDSTTKTKNVEEPDRRHSSIIPPVGKANQQTKGNKPDDLDETKLGKETANGPRAGPGVKVAWKKTGRGPGGNKSKGMAFKNPSFVPDADLSQGPSVLSDGPPVVPEQTKASMEQEAAIPSEDLGTMPSSSSSHAPGTRPSTASLAGDLATVGLPNSVEDSQTYLPNAVPAADSEIQATMEQEVSDGSEDSGTRPSSSSSNDSGRGTRPPSATDSGTRPSSSSPNPGTRPPSSYGSGSRPSTSPSGDLAAVHDPPNSVAESQISLPHAVPPAEGEEMT